jgi:hypothetical protein
MTGDYRSYTFSLGESPKRNYKGMRTSVSKGAPFAFEIINKWKTTAIAFATDIYQQQALSQGEMSEEQKSKLELEFILKICVEIDLEEVMSQGSKILGDQSTPIIASEDNSPKSFVLSNEKQFDDWFEAHPEDLMQVYGYAIWNNVKPFIPSFMDKLQAAGTMKETQNPMQEIS